MKHGFARLLMMHLLAACDDGQPPQNVTKMVPSNAIPTSSPLMTPLYRNLGLWRAHPRFPASACKKIDIAASPAGLSSNMAMWTRALHRHRPVGGVHRPQFRRPGPRLRRQRRAQAS